MDELETKIADLTAEIGRLADTRAQAAPAAKAADGGRYAAALDGSAEIAAKLTELDALRGEQKAKADKAALEAMIGEAVKAAMRDTRSPSMAGIIGQGAPLTEAVNRRLDQAGVLAHPALKASFADYQAGELLAGIVAQQVGSGFDPDAAQWGKAKLASLGIVHMGVPEMSKATLGATGATGGYVLPNNLVDTLAKPATQAAVYTGAGALMTVIPGVAVRGVDQPYRTGAPTRMTFQDWGTTKENLDEAYGSYTALLGTIARVYDIGKQYARFSAGAAERDVIDELSRAAALAENYYAIAGAGTGTQGVGDPTTGVYTAIVAGAATYTTSHTASSSTVAGSAGTGLAKGLQALAKRSRSADAIVLDADTYWTLFQQGSDNAGFWMSELLGAGFQVGGDNALRFRGIQVLYDANLGTNATTKIALLAEWKSFKFYRGMEFRIDSSDVAGDRWDKNLIGFRGEEEIGINASTAVSVGAAQLITGLIP